MTNSYLVIFDDSQDAVIAHRKKLLPRDFHFNPRLIKEQDPIADLHVGHRPALAVLHEHPGADEANDPGATRLALEGGLRRVGDEEATDLVGGRVGLDEDSIVESFEHLVTFRRFLALLALGLAPQFPDARHVRPIATDDSAPLFPGARRFFARHLMRNACLMRCFAALPGDLAVAFGIHERKPALALSSTHVDSLT
jgi:hypothetical protein